METLTMNNAGTVVRNAAPTSGQSRGSLPFRLLLIYLLFEFGRLQDGIPLIGKVQLPMLSLLGLGFLLVTHRALTLREPTTKLFVVLLVFMGLHIPFAVNTFWSFHTARAMALTFIGYLGVISFVDSPRKYRTLINGWLAIHIVLAIYGLLHKGRGVGGWIGDENDFCLVLNMALPYAYFLTFSDDNITKKTLHLGMVVLFLATIMSTFSRGGFLGLVAVGLYCWFRSSRKLISGVLILLLALIVINFAPQGYWEEMGTIQKEYSGEIVGTGTGRQYSWNIGWKMFVANPVFGIGQGNFQWEFGRYEGDETFFGQSLAGRAAHSLYYTLMPELGLVGIVIFLGMNYYLFKNIAAVKRLFRARRNIMDGGDARFLFHTACALEASLIGYLVTGYFVSILYYPSFWILVGFAVALRKVAFADDAKSVAAH
jgi:probable O-glycosylation ligase (exosortase A-associated)